MPSTIKVELVEALVFLKAVCKVIPSGIGGCKFNITPEECTTALINESETVRSFLSTNAMTSPVPIEFSFQDVTKLVKVLGSFSKGTKNNVIEIMFNDNHLAYKGEIDFKLKTVQYEKIEKYVSKGLKSELKDLWNAELQSALMANIASYSSIIYSTGNKMNLTQRGADDVIATVIDPNNKFSDTIGLPIGKLRTGNIETPLWISIDTFSLFSLIPAESVQIAFTDKNVLTVNSGCRTEDGIYIKNFMVSTVLKGPE